MLDLFDGGHGLSVTVIESHQRPFATDNENRTGSMPNRLLAVPDGEVTCADVCNRASRNSLSESNADALRNYDS